MFKRQRQIHQLLFLVLGVLGFFIVLFPIAGSIVTASESVQIIATTTIVQDLVKQVAGERAVVKSLLRPGMDPHTYRAVPADLVAVSRADVIFVHGAGLDAWAQHMVEKVRPKASIFAVTEGLTDREIGGDAGHQDKQGHERDEVGEDAPEPHDQHDHEDGDPHYWLDPNLVKRYIENIEKTLVAADPAGADTYHENAANYLAELAGLDAWIRTRVAEIPSDRRKLVTNHDSLSYFARRYGFEVIGTVIPGFSSEAEPSARQVAQLARTLQSAGVSVIFTETTVNPKLARAVAREAGRDVRVVSLYTGSLSTAEGPADTYFNFMRYNVNAMVEALR